MSKILNQYKAKEVMEGGGTKVNRVFGYGQTKTFDPFLMLDYFETDSNEPSKGFPWHPHKGIETITYMLRGNIEHQDTLGNKDVIGPGELQWMTAGRGIMHQETPLPAKDGFQGFQFWVNLKSTDKLTEPKYQDIKKGQMKSYKDNGLEIKVISGSYKGVIGPIQKPSLGINMYHVILEQGFDFAFQRDISKQGYIFLFKGEGVLNNDHVTKKVAYALDHGDYTYHANEDTEFIFAEGVPLQEPIAWYGPVVMNTREELEQTFDDIRNNRFVPKEANWKQM